ncbi:MAG: thioredoxin-disulfide reductase [Methylacidiphilales bacterium]|nr:thioredoxin-disulfide reductase [Candidatus Methylacidiphilales bacterium]MDW8349170.1 thioredoxin-disulfide reductase [Verrucomicrobiae bacterium]
MTQHPIENVVILGTGCAGLTAALYTARAGLAPLVLTGNLPGGLLTTTSIVENFPGFPEGIDGTELMMRMQAQAERFGARIRFAQLTSANLHTYPFQLEIEGDWISARALIIATGSSPRKLGLESERLLEKKGVTYCATCDGALPMFRNRPLVVVGGGDSAAEEALYLTRFGSEIHLVHRRDTLRASKIMAERVLAHPKIKLHWNSEIAEIHDVQQGKVTGVTLRSTVAPDHLQFIECAGVFIAIGHVPNVEIFKNQLTTDANGYLKPERGTAMNIPGVFACGDVADPIYRQAITAAGTGCAAAIEAERFLATQNI